MEQELKQLKAQFQAELNQANTAQAQQELRIKFLGRKGEINALFGRLAQLPAEQKAFWGQQLNQLKNQLTATLDQCLANQTNNESQLDLTLPPQGQSRGSWHILSRVNQEICAIFQNLGFQIIEGAEIEDDWHNFGALNFPSDHPSKDAFDTFYLDLPPDKKFGAYLLRCHTSPSQIRIMEQNSAPLAIISPGRVYRPDEVDSTHSFMFHQIEGFAVGPEINFSHLKGVLFHFAQEFFSVNAKLRFRPHFFPFTEPSAEVDVSCFKCGGQPVAGQLQKMQKCNVCKGKGWLEILGCGMIHPNVLKACNIDPKKNQGFAFGMGVERPAMLKYGIDDIRLFTENDIKFLEQF